MKISSPLRFLSTDGRASRIEFVGVTLGVAAAEYLLVALLHLVFGWEGLRVFGPTTYVGCLLLGGWLLITVAVRRLHDLGERSGFMFAGGITMAVVLAFLGKLSWVGDRAGWIALFLFIGAYLFLALRRGVEGRNGYNRQPRIRLDADESTAEARRLQRQMALPALRLQETSDAVISKLGGSLALPTGMAWPQTDGLPEVFLAQIDLGEVRSSDGPEWLPPDGRIYIFLRATALDGPAMVRCLFTREPPGASRSFPEGTEPAFNERRVVFTRHVSLPSLDWLGYEFGALRTEDLFDLADAPDKPFGEGVQHRLGGYPSEIQGGQLAIEAEFASRGQALDYNRVTPEIERAAKDWRLFLQIDSDDELGMNWVDTGRLYLFIREQDARVGDFTKTVTLCQFY